MLQTFEKLFKLDAVAQMFHDNVQDDKRPALLALDGLMKRAGAEYVISGGLATQLHDSDPRFTGDVNVVARHNDAVQIIDAIQHFTNFSMTSPRSGCIRCLTRFTPNPRRPLKSTRTSTINRMQCQSMHAVPART